MDARSVVLLVIMTMADGIGAGMPYEEEWGYVHVRPSANMFWWLYRESERNVTERKPTLIKRPLIIWLQGGPGDSGTGYGNFQEIGPMDVNLRPRNTTWLTRADLLFIDSPVGSGFSYADPSDFAVSMDQIVDDLMNFTYEWFGAQEDYRTRPIFVFGESFGGKVAVAYVWRLYQHISRKDLQMNLKGVGLGNSWISPIDFMLSWPDFLYFHSWLSPRGLAEVKAKTDECHDLAKAGLWSNTSACIQDIAGLVHRRTAGVSWYNILKHEKTDAYSRKMGSAADSPITVQLDLLMNGPIREKLRIIPDAVRWVTSDPVYYALYDEMMRSAVPVVDQILQNTDLHVFVYNGQLDLICNTPGVQTWLKRLKWPGMEKYYEAPRIHLPRTTGETDESREMFMQRYDRFWFFWVLHAGHNVPADAGEASLKLLDVIFADLLIKEGLKNGK